MKYRLPEVPFQFPEVAQLLPVLPVQYLAAHDCEGTIAMQIAAASAAQNDACFICFSFPPRCVAVCLGCASRLRAPPSPKGTTMIANLIPPDKGEIGRKGRKGEAARVPLPRDCSSN